MIKEIKIQSFCGVKSATFEMHNRQIITGDCSAFKTKIATAAELALRGYAADIDKTPQAIWTAFALESGEGGVMSVAVITDDGRSITRQYKKNGDSVSQEVWINGETSCISDATEKHTRKKVGVSIFNFSKFWDSTGRERLDTLCRVAGLDPVRLDALDAEILSENDKKREAAHDLKGFRETLQVLKEQLQKVAISDGVNIGGGDERAAELQKKIIEIGDEINAVRVHNERLHSADLRRDAICKTLEELSKEVDFQTNGVLPEEELARLRGEQGRLESRVEACLRREKFEMELSERCPVERLVFQKDNELKSLEEEIKLLEKGETIQSGDYEILEFAREIWKDISPESKSILSVKIAPCKKRTEAHQSKDDREAHIAAAKADFSKLLLERKAVWNKNTAADRLDNDTEELRIEISKITAEPLTSEEFATLKEINSMISESMQGELDARASKRQKAQREAEIAALTAELSSLATGGRRWDKALIAEQGKHKEEFVKLNLMIRADERCKAKREDIERTAEDLKGADIKKKARALREANLIKEKADMLETLSVMIERKMCKITSPGTVKIELVSAKAGYVRFLLKTERGNVCYATLGGHQKVEFDIALASALFGSEGCIIRECSESNLKHASTMLPKLERLKGQVILISHIFEGKEFSGWDVLEAGQ